MADSVKVAGYKPFKARDQHSCNKACRNPRIPDRAGRDRSADRPEPVREAAVMAREDSHGDTRQVAYVTPQYSGGDDAASHPADFSYAPEEEYDTVILNYVVMYFPGVRRQFGVIEGAIKSIRSRGHMPHTAVSLWSERTRSRWRKSGARR
jgi:hypothetical protein